jgi:hypothetical protein
LDAMGARPSAPSDSSESSESPSSDESEDTVCLPVRPPTPHDEIPESNEVEPFPDFETGGESEAHCSMHCSYAS